MTDQPKLFFSHSLHALPDSDDRCKLANELVNCLNVRWKVFKDNKRIAMGDLWQDEVYHALSHCQAAIVYFNSNANKPGGLANKKDALTSDWVTIESLVLCLRAAFDKKFRVVPILLDDLELADTCFSVFSPLELIKRLAISAPTNLDNPQVRARFVEQVNQKLDPNDVPDPNPSNWVSLLSGYVEKLNDPMLDEMADSLNIEIAWSTANRRELLPPIIAQCIYTRKLGDSLPAIGHFKAIHDTNIRQELLAHLLTLLVGHEQITVARAVFDEPKCRQLVVSCDASVDALLLIHRIQTEKTDLQLKHVSLDDEIPDLDVHPDLMLDEMADWLDIKIARGLIPEEIAAPTTAAAARQYIEDAWSNWIIVCIIPRNVWMAGLGEKLNTNRSRTTYLISGNASGDLDLKTQDVPSVSLPSALQRATTQEQVKSMITFAGRN